MAGSLAAAQTAFTSLDRGSLIRVLPKLHTRVPKIVGASVVLHVLVMLLGALDGGGLSVRLSESLGLPAAVGVPVFGAGFVIVLLAFGEFLPRHLARARPEGIVRISARPLSWAAPPLDPLLSASTSITRGVLSIFGLRPAPEAPVVTEEEISHFIALGERAGVLERREREMLHSVLRFSDTLVRQVMVARTDMFCVDVDRPLAEVVEKVGESHYSRVPAYRGHMDNIVGILYAKDLLPIASHREVSALPALVRKPVFVPETMRLSDLLREFQRGKLHLAIVVDEFGGTAGLITLEDLLEEIVGEIRDEYDTEEAAPEAAEDGSYTVDGRMELARLRSLLRLEIPEPPGVSTVAGLVVAQAGRIPRERAGVIIGPARFIVEEASAKRIRRVRVVPLVEPAGGSLLPTEKTEEVRVEPPAETPTRRTTKRRLKPASANGRPEASAGSGKTRRRGRGTTARKHVEGGEVASVTERSSASD